MNTEEFELRRYVIVVDVICAKCGQKFREMYEKKGTWHQCSWGDESLAVEVERSEFGTVYLRVTCPACKGEGVVEID